MESSGSSTEKLDDSGPGPSGAIKNGKGRRLAEAIDDANLLIWYASNKGISDVQKTTLEALTTSTETYFKSGLKGDEESVFWDSYRLLAKSIRPVSVDSIKHTYGLEGKGKSSAKKVIRVYSIFTLTVLFFLIALQTYWFVGTSMRTDIETLKNRLLKSQSEALAINAEKENLKKITDALDQDINNMKENGTSSEQQTELTSQLLEANDKLTLVLREGEELQRQVFADQFMLRSNIIMLATWDIASELLPEEVDQRELREKIEALKKSQDEIKSDIAKMSRDNNSKDLIENKRRQLSLLVQQEAQYKEDEKKLSETLSQRASQSVLAIFSEYLLPLLYGLLGALAYILRTLTTEIQQVTYTSSSNVRYRLRWPLGMLAGVTIGWFFDPKTLEGAAAITPLGLAFLAGYSVELLFTGLDRIVGAFTGGQGAAAK